MEEDGGRKRLLTEHRYMAKAPSTAASFDGSGKVWFKILDIGPTFTNQVSSWNLLRIYPPFSPPLLFFLSSTTNYQPIISLLAIHPRRAVHLEEREANQTSTQKHTHIPSHPMFPAVTFFSAFSSWLFIILSTLFLSTIYLLFTPPFFSLPCFSIGSP